MIRNACDCKHVVIVNIFDYRRRTGNFNGETVAAVKGVFSLVNGDGVVLNVQAVDCDRGAVVGDGNCTFFLFDGVTVGGDGLICISRAKKERALIQSQSRCGINGNICAVVVNDGIVR